MTAAEPAPLTSRAAVIADTAARLFHERGYSGTSIDEIGTALGVTGPAIYRHFRGKAALLEAVVEGAVTRLEAIAALLDLDAVVDGLVEAAVDGAALGSVLEGDLRHLAPAARRRARRRLDACHSRIASAIGTASGAGESGGGRRVDIGVFIARSMVSIAGSGVFSPSSRETCTFPDLLASTLRSAASWRPTADDFVKVGPPTVVTRRWLPAEQAVIAAVPELLSVRGSFDEISVEDLGAAAGLTATSLYTYFEGKRDVLARAAEQAMAWEWSSLQQAMAFSSDRVDVMRRALSGYVELTTRVPVFGAPLELTNASASEETRAAVETFTAGYLTLWRTCAAAARPELDAIAVDVVLGASHAVVNGASVIPVGEVRPTPDALASFALAIFQS